MTEQTKKPKADKKAKKVASVEVTAMDKDNHPDVADIKTTPSTSNSATSSTMPIQSNKSVSTAGYHGADETISVGPTPAPLDSINTVPNKAPSTVSVAKHEKKKKEHE